MLRNLREGYPYNVRVRALYGDLSGKDTEDQVVASAFTDSVTAIPVVTACCQNKEQTWSTFHLCAT